MSYARPESLVSIDWLAEHLDDADLRVVEVDEDTGAYEKGHIPGAIAWNCWATDLHHPVRRDYLDQLQGLYTGSGVTGDRETIVM